MARSGHNGLGGIPRNVGSVHGHGVNDFTRGQVSDLKPDETRSGNKCESLLAVDGKGPRAAQKRSHSANDEICRGIGDFKIIGERGAGSVPVAEIDAIAIGTYDGVVRSDTSACYRSQVIAIGTVLDIPGAAGGSLSSWHVDFLSVGRNRMAINAVRVAHGPCNLIGG